MKRNTRKDNQDLLTILALGVAGYLAWQYLKKKNAASSSSASLAPASGPFSDPNLNALLNSSYTEEPFDYYQQFRASVSGVKRLGCPLTI